MENKRILLLLLLLFLVLETCTCTFNGENTVDEEGAFASHGVERTYNKCGGAPIPW